MPKFFFIFSFLLIFAVFMIAPRTYAFEESGDPTDCNIITKTELAPELTDTIFYNTIKKTPEPFKLFATSTVADKSHQFNKDFSPYKAWIEYGIPTQDTFLGDMRLVPSVPNTDDGPNITEDDTKECVKKKVVNKEDVCIQYAEDTDPKDRIDSWNIASKDENYNDTTFGFGALGVAKIYIYQNNTNSSNANNTDPNNPVKTGLVCSKQIRVMPSKLITVGVDQPLPIGQKVIISGVVLDHALKVIGATVSLRIGGRTVTAKTDNEGKYKYDSDTTAQWGLTIRDISVNVSASAIVNGELITGGNKFGVGIGSPNTSGTLNTGTNATVDLLRYYCTGAKNDHWTTTALQQPAPPANECNREGSQGLLNQEDDGDGPLTTLYDCVNDAGHFNSTNYSECSAKGKGYPIGFIYDPTTTQPSGTHRLYLCKDSATGEQKTTITADCKDKTSDTTTYALEKTLGYVYDSSPLCDLPAQNTPDVTADINQHQKFLDIENPKILAQQIVKETQNDPRNNQPALTGVNYDSCLGLYCLVNIVGQFACKTFPFLGLKFCTQKVVLGRGTNLFDNESKAFHKGYVANIQRSPQPYAQKVIEDANPACHKANGQISQITDRMGNDASLYTAEFPKNIVTNNVAQFSAAKSQKNVLGTSTQGKNLPLISGPNQQVELNQGGAGFEYERTGQLDPNLCLYFRGNYPKGIIPEGFQCPEIQSTSNLACTTSGNMADYQKKYGFNTPDNNGYGQHTSSVSPAKFPQFFQQVKEAVALMAPKKGVDPVFVAWWAFFETGGKDAYHWSNCGDVNHDVNSDCSASAWQLGFGQQYSDHVGSLEADFKEVYSTTDPEKIRLVGQNVYSKAGQSKTFPAKPINQLSHYEKSVLMRDPLISAYQNAVTLSGLDDSDGEFKEVSFKWGSYYKDNWQEASNLMKDVLLAWQQSCN